MTGRHFDLPFGGLWEGQAAELDLAIRLDQNSLLLYTEVRQQMETVDRVKGTHGPAAVSFLQSG